MEHKIGFDQIKNMLADNCQSQLGREHIDALTWCNDIDIIRQQQEETN
jgi:dsDNA-specific endonuclease/ATPase MutS2